MCRHSPIVWCALLLVITYALENRGNSSLGNKQNDTVQYETHVNLITIWNQDKNSTRDDEDLVHYEFYRNYVKNLDVVSNQNVPSELRGNFTKSDDGGNFTMAHAFRLGTNSNEENFNKCNGTVCIPICCELGYRMIRGICTSDDGDYTFPEVDEIGKKINEVFPLVVSDSCNFGRYLLDPTLYPKDEYIVLVNGSIYQPLVDRIIDPTTYCFAVVNKSNYELLMCFGPESMLIAYKTEIFGTPFGVIVSLSFLLITFVVYTILPELWNMHGYILRGYVGSLFVAQVFIVNYILTSRDQMSKEICIGSAFVMYFSLIASFFWLNVMCFDIWWTFRGFRSLQGSEKQQEKKKFTLYSIYAWGCTALLTIICAIMDFVPSVSKTFFKPEFGEITCWFKSDEANALYLYIPLCVIIIWNICLFICTASNIARYEKETAHQLRGLESRRHNDNKQRFYVYLKLFIVMFFRDGISWSMEVIFWRVKDPPPIFAYILHLMNALQGVIVFYMFVWKNKIKNLLLKRFSCKKCAIFSRKSKACHNMALRTYATSTGVIPLQESLSPHIQTNLHAKNLSDETNRF